MNNFQRLFLCLLTIALLVSCGKDEPGKNGILTINKMKLVMWDVMQVDEFANTFMVKDSLLNIPKESGKMYEKVFGIHNVSSQQFYSSFDFYRKHPRYFKILLDSVSAFGNRERDSGLYKSRPVLIPDK